MTSPARRLLVGRLHRSRGSGLVPVRRLAQGGATSTLSGTVTDTSGAVIPGASVVVKRADTGLTSEAVTNTEGQFTIPQLAAGQIHRQRHPRGLQDRDGERRRSERRRPRGRERQARSRRHRGAGRRHRRLRSRQDAVVHGLDDADDQADLEPADAPSRSALDFVANLAGVNTPGGVRDSTVNGLPQGSINITLDGMSIQDNYLKTTDGFFARVSPRLDAIEEVTVTSAANGADSGGQGAINIRFVTKSGTNVFKGSAFFTLRHDGLNANTFFNNRNLPADPATGKAPKAELRQYQPGFNAGGPIVIPGLWDGRDKAFFFFAYEDNRSPSKITRNRVILTPAGHEWRLHLRQHHGEPPAARGAERADGDARSGRREAVRRHAQRVVERQHHQPVGSDPAAGLVPGGQQQLHAVSGRPRRLQPDQESPAVGLVHPQQAGLDARHDEQPRAVLPGLPEHGQPAVHAATSPRCISARPSGRTSSTRSMAGRRAARPSSRPSSRRRSSAATASATRTATS